MTTTGFAAVLALIVGARLVANRERVNDKSRCVCLSRSDATPGRLQRFTSRPRNKVPLHTQRCRNGSGCSGVCSEASRTAVGYQKGAGGKNASPHYSRRRLPDGVGLVRAFLSQNSLRPRVRLADWWRSPQAQSGHVSEIHESSASAAFRRSRGRLVLAMACGLALPTAARADVFVVSPPRITAPPVSQAPPAVTVPFWMPLPAEGPRLAPPKPLCYAGNQSCPLERPNALSGNCTCRSPNGSVTGRALIPPSRHIGEKG